MIWRTCHMYLIYSDFWYKGEITTGVPDMIVILMMMLLQGCHVVYDFFFFFFFGVCKHIEYTKEYEKLKRKNFAPMPRFVNNAPTITIFYYHQSYFVIRSPHMLFIHRMISIRLSNDIRINENTKKFQSQFLVRHMHK